MDLVFLCLLVLMLSLIVLWARFRKENFSIFKRNGIPGPEPSFWTGNFNDLALKREECLLEYVKKYGNIFGFFVGTAPLLVVADPELMKIIQVRDFGKFVDREFILPDMGVPHPEFTDSLFPSGGETWKRNRILVSPAFSTRKLKKIMPIINTAIEIFLDKLRVSRNEEFVNIVKLFRDLTLDISTKTMLGIDTGVQHAAKSKMLDSTHLFLSIGFRDILPAIGACFPEIEPIPTKLRSIIDALKNIFGLPSIRHAFEEVEKVVDYRRKHSEKREDLLQNLMDGKVSLKQGAVNGTVELEDSNESIEDNREKSKHESPKRSEHFFLSDSGIVVNACNLLMAGYDTSNTTLSFLSYELTRHQDIQDRLREEIKEQLAGKTEITYEDLSKLNYMDQVLSETLRMHPTNMLSLTRIASEPLKYKGMTIPKGMAITMPPYVLHRNPDSWSDPEKFDPERFSPESKGALSPDIYQPFGNGPRYCVGKRFAQLVLKLTMTKLILSYRLKSHGDEVKEPKTEYNLFLTAPHELLLKIEPIS